MEENNIFRFEVLERIAVLSTDSKGWRKEVNRISYNGKKPMLDIRKWSPNGNMSKGIALKDEEVQVLKEVLAQLQFEKEKEEQ